MIVLEAVELAKVYRGGDGGERQARPSGAGSARGTRGGCGARQWNSDVGHALSSATEHIFRTRQCV